MSDLLLIDLSALVHANWHALTNDPNPDATSIKTVERVRALASGVPFVGIACDSPAPSFRKDIDPNYKANRKAEERAPLYHQMRLAIETLKADGFPVYEVPGFEADDIIATACKQTFLKPRELDRVVIATSDKDLATLVTTCARVGEHDETEIAPIVLKSLKDGSIIDVDGVKQKFGVPPSLVVDWLTLVGDASDNVPGCDSIGPKWASALLLEFGSLDNVYKAIDKGLTPTITPSRRAKLQEFRAQWPITRQLIQLRFDVPINVEAMFQPRIAQNDVAVFGDEAPDASFSDLPNDAAPSRVAPSGGDSAQPLNFTASSGATPLGPKAEESAQSFTYEDALKDIDAAMPGLTAPKLPPLPPHLVIEPKPAFADAVAGVKTQSEVMPSDPTRRHSDPSAKDQQSIGRSVDAGAGSLSLVPARSAELVDYERQLEPRSLAEAFTVAKTLFQSRIFSQWGSEQAVFAIIMRGRELDIPAVASLMAFHNIENKPSPSADLMQALVLRSGKVKYFYCKERLPNKATYVTQRHEDPEPTSLTYTIEEARGAWKKDERAWNASNWGNPEKAIDMCVARAKAKLCRLVAPDAVFGLYAPEEFD